MRYSTYPIVAAAGVIFQILLPSLINKGFTQGGSSIMNGNGTVLQSNSLHFPINEQQAQDVTELIFEEIQIERGEVTEIESRNKETRFARLKRALRKRSSASIL